MDQKSLLEAGRRLLDPLVAVLADSGVRPAAVTVLGLAITFLASVLVWSGDLFFAAVLLSLGSVLDAADGALARRLRMESASGAVLDSTADRLGEALVFIGIIAGETARIQPVLLYLAPAALCGSFAVSYVRARAEGVGIECRVGVFARTERLLVTIFGLALAGLWDERILPVAVGILALGSFVTASHRLWHVHRSSGKAPGS
ncbi:CDP-alcohol phosphatidyltransferase family protein [Candidatus Fermentibacterales bacterium]|nr:CDP-alcohol phosphatidyltransferase family protein [Candidatus Fermentibacterales bacterium]